MNDIALTPEYLEHLLALGKAVPAGPWGTSLNAFELFGKDFTDWGEVYANLTLDNGHVFKGSVIAHANTNLVSEEEKLAAREAYLMGEKVDPGLSGKLATYIAAYHPGVTTALILEILRLRGEVERLKEDNEAYRVVMSNFQRITTNLANEIDENDKDYEAEVANLEAQIDWLAARCHEFCDFNNYCNECALYPGNINFPHPDCGVKLVDEGRARARFMKHTVDWREAAREAVEEKA